MAFRVFYVCEAGLGAGFDNKPRKCNTLTGSSLRARLHDNPTQKGQKWYCPGCLARYKTTFGMVVEFVVNGESLFLKADFPSKDMMDMKAMMVERAYGGHCSTGAELLKLLPEVHPVGRELLVQLEVDAKGNPCRGSYKFPGKILKELPTFEWDTLYKI